MRDRYLFFADRDASTYRDLLEIRPGRARLLTPSEAARSWRWLSSILVFIAYTAIMGPICFIALALGISLFLPLWVGYVLAAVAWAAGLLRFYVWWDRRNLPFLAETPAQVVDLQLLGARSFGSYQDVRARTPQGEELHLVVDAHAPPFWEAVRFLEGRPAPSA